MFPKIKQSQVKYTLTCIFLILTEPSDMFHQEPSPTSISLINSFLYSPEDALIVRNLYIYGFPHCFYVKRCFTFHHLLSQLSLLKI